MPALGLKLPADTRELVTNQILVNFLNFHINLPLRCICFLYFAVFHQIKLNIYK